MILVLERIRTRYAAPCTVVYRVEDERGRCLARFSYSYAHDGSAIPARIDALDFSGIPATETSP